MSNKKVRECFACMSPVEIKEIKGLRITYICTNPECEREFSIVEMDPEIAKIFDEISFDLF